jgi:hypothetical protein
MVRILRHIVGWCLLIGPFAWLIFELSKSMGLCNTLAALGVVVVIFTVLLLGFYLALGDL